MLHVESVIAFDTKLVPPKTCLVGESVKQNFLPFLPNFYKSKGNLV